jgi:maltose alpha-D-glucosyltransferase/alpha-amylase
MQDFIDLIEAAHQRSLRVIADLVLNHTSDQHPWFQASRTSKDSPYRDYYVWSDTDQKYRDARIIFIDSEPSNWTWDSLSSQYYWHRFYACQPDLNFENPKVRREMLDVARFWLDLGVDGFRVDAVPYLFESEGTNCENLPDTHDYLKELRMMLDLSYPGRVLLCEANQWPVDVRPYLGDGDEFHIAFHFPLMPRIFMAIRKGSPDPITWILEQTPAIPENCQWGTFLRNHDELTLEMVTEEERQWMWEQYAPEPRMRLNLGIRRRLAPLLDNDRRKIELANALLFSLPGSPTIYYGDEIGMGDNIWLKDRDGVRTPMQWDNSANAGFSKANPDILYTPVIEGGQFDYRVVNVEEQRKDPNSLLNWIRKLIRIRKENPAFGSGDIEFVDPMNQHILAFHRRTTDQTLLVANNFSENSQEFQIDLTNNPPKKIVDVISNETYTGRNPNKLQLKLDPYGYCWFKFTDE